ncbi:MAG: ABC transporter permease [Planctomycetota bacterium]|jgi:putative ABC transport system permease protein
MLRFAVRNLLSRRARSLLSLAGLTVAIAGMVGLFSIAVGINAMVTDTFDRIPGMIVMQKGAPIPLFSRVPRAWAKEIEELPGVNAVSAEIWVRANVINGKEIVSPPRFFFGADIQVHQKMLHNLYVEAIVEGRYLNESDLGTANTCVSRQIAEEFELELGDTFVVNGEELTVVGIYYCGSLLLDIAIIVDQEYVRQASRFDPNTVCSFYVEPTGEIPNEEIVAWMQDMFRDRSLSAWSATSLIFGGGTSVSSSDDVMPSGNPLVDFFRKADQAIKKAGVDPQDSESRAATEKETQKKSRVSGAGADGAAQMRDDDGPLEIRSASDWAQQFEKFTADLDLFLTIMTSVGLVIAVLSIVNTMLMSVSERIIEFGVLKANGWSQGDVMRLITFESAVLGFGGGVCGCAIGWVMTQVVNYNWPDQLHLLASPGLLAFSLIFATLLGIGGGLYPAVWATRMMPMDAIRRG